MDNFATNSGTTPLIRNIMMKKILPFAGIAVVVFALGSCKAFKGAAISAKPDPIEVHADTIKYEIHATVPPNAGIKKGGIYSGDAVIGSRNQAKVGISTDKYPAIKKTGVDTTIKIT